MTLLCLPTRCKELGNGIVSVLQDDKLLEITPPIGKYT